MHPSCRSEFMARCWRSRARQGRWAAEMDLAKCFILELLEVTGPGWAGSEQAERASRRSAGSSCSALVQGLAVGRRACQGEGGASLVGDETVGALGEEPRRQGKG